MPSKPRIQIRQRLPIIGLLLFLALSLVLPSRIWMTLLIGLGGVFIISFIWARQLSKGLRGSRRLRFGWVAVGDRLSEEFEIRNECSLPALWVEIIDHSNVPGYEVAVVRSVREHGSEHWRQFAICHQRGQYRLGPWELRSADPFGIFQVSVPCEQYNDIVIHPPVHTQIPIPLPAGASSGRVRAKARSWQATINAAAVREYQFSDPLPWIHWPTTARRDELYSRQFDLDAAGDIWLLLDLRADVQLGEGLDGTEEHAVLLAAALAAQAIDQNRPVGLAAYGQEPRVVPPGRGRGQQWNLLHSLALVRANGETDLSLALEDISQLIKQGSALVIITPAQDAGWLPNLLNLAQRGIRCHVSLLDRETFNDKRERAAGTNRALREAIRHLGVDCNLIRRGDVGQPTELQKRQGFWEFKVTATGKVVTVQSPFERS
jgi:uncharacterized protein (DUF58 family)